MKKGLTVVFFIFIYFFMITNVFAMEKQEIEKFQNEEIDILDSEELIEEKDILEENSDETIEEKKDYLTDLEKIEEVGNSEIVEIKENEEVYDKSISGEEFEITYNVEEYKALNFSVENNNENQSTVYAVILDEKTIYEEYFEEKQREEVKLNIEGKLVKLCLKGNGTYINPYLSNKNNTYSITYDDEKKYETEDSKYIIEKEAEKEGYIFKNYESETKKKYYPEEEIYLNNDLSLKSVYEEEEYQVTYNYLDNIVNKTYTINNNSLFIPEIDGYEFLGWFDIDGNKINSLTTGNISLYAKIKKIETLNKRMYVSKLNYEYNEVYKPTNISEKNIDNIEPKEDNIKNKIVNIEQIETPFNSKTLKVNYIFIIGILIILIAVLVIFKFSLKS